MPEVERTAETIGGLYGTCGHRCNEVIEVRHYGEDVDHHVGVVRCVVYSAMCPSCAADAATWPEFIKPEDWERVEREFPNE